MERLIWFMHFHKAAGSSVVELARRGGERFPDRHENGNPCDERGRADRPWELSTAGLHRYIDGLRADGITFVASEWGVPDTSVLAARDDVTSITVVREPVARIVSNFRYDLAIGAYGAGAAPSLAEYVDHHVASHTWSNYYTRMLLGTDWVADLDPTELIDRAWERLSRMDEVVRLEDPNWQSRLAARTGWSGDPVRIHQTDADWRTRLRKAAGGLRAGRADVTARALWRKPPTARPDELAMLEQLNHLDVALYRRLSALP